MAYASAGSSLAILEILVHHEDDVDPADYRLLEIDVPDELVEILRDLPPGWNQKPPYSPAAQLLGDEWVQSDSSVALLVPSAVNPREQNVLINPAHPGFGQLTLHRLDGNFLDLRLFL